MHASSTRPTLGNWTSTLSRSREKRLTIRPKGVLSKKDIGALKMDLNRSEWRWWEAFRKAMAMAKACNVVKITEERCDNTLISSASRNPSGIILNESGWHSLEDAHVYYFYLTTILGLPLKIHALVPRFSWWFLWISYFTNTSWVDLHAQLGKTLVDNFLQSLYQ